MCHRITPLLASELQQALNDLASTGRARIPSRDPNIVVPDAYPGTQVPLFTTTEEGSLQVAVLSWGFSATIAGKSKRVFNTRLDTALQQATTGRGMWAEPIYRGRCLVPVRSFYESWTKSTVRRSTNVRFTMPGHRVFLLAGIHAHDCFSIVTTEPNATVGRFHTRMPLVLGLGESSIWLGPNFASLSERTNIQLDALPEEVARTS